MTGTPLSERTRIVLFGARNAGKSSLFNALVGKTASIVSDTPGTTTDPVTVPAEFSGLGPCAFTDTAGLDDEGELGALRVMRSGERLAWADILVLVTPADRPPLREEMDGLGRAASSGKPVVIAKTFADMAEDPVKRSWLESLDNGKGCSPRVVDLGGPGHPGLPDLRLAIVEAGLGAAGAECGPLEGLVSPGDLVLLVTPVDSAAPKGRLILPQAETLRDALDRGGRALVTRETELAQAVARLAERPRLVVTDSQAFALVAQVIPSDWPLTSFSILFARKKGEIARFMPGIRFLEGIAAKAGMGATDPLRLLAIEACSHNRTHEDIATAKIPALLGARTGRPVTLTVTRELRDAAISPGSHDLAAVCGGCMATRGKMGSQLAALADAGIPVVNFGMFLAWSHGVFPRALDPLALT